MSLKVSSKAFRTAVQRNGAGCFVWKGSSSGWDLLVPFNSSVWRHLPVRIEMLSVNMFEAYLEDERP